MIGRSIAERRFHFPKRYLLLSLRYCSFRRPRLRGEASSACDTHKSNSKNRNDVSRHLRVCAPISFLSFRCS